MYVATLQIKLTVIITNCIQFLMYMGTNGYKLHIVYCSVYVRTMLGFNSVARYSQPISYFLMYLVLGALKAGRV